MAYGTSNSINNNNNNNQENLDRHLKIDDKLDSHLKPVKIGEDQTGLQLADKDVRIENDLTVRGDTLIEGSSTSGYSTINVYEQVEVFTERDALKINFEDKSNTAHTSRGLNIDFDLVAPTANSATATAVGVNIDMDSVGEALSLSYVNMIGIDVDLNGSTDGIETATGISIDADGADTNTGLKINTAGTHIHLEANADTDDYATLSVADTGDLTITTVGDGTTDSDLLLDVDGAITLDSANGNFIAKKAGTEFSVANSAYAGMLVGYSYFRNTDDVSGDDLITIDTTMTVLQTTNGNDVAITFKAPPSGNVEILFSAMVYGSSKEVMFALSDNASFNELNQIHTYDAWSHKMDETDQNQVHIPFVVTGLTAGTSYTYYIAADSSGADAYIYHGSTRTNTYSPPITIKAIALPATITTGT